jgi:hypothetical protein
MLSKFRWRRLFRSQAAEMMLHERMLKFVDIPGIIRHKYNALKKLSEAMRFAAQP